MGVPRKKTAFLIWGLGLWPGAVGQGIEGARLVLWRDLMSRFLQPLLSLPLQKTLKCQNLPQSHQHRLHGLSHLRALRACSQQDLNLAAWSGPPSKTVPGKRPAWTTPMRSRGSLLSSVASPGQTGVEGSRGEPRTGGK